MDGVKAAMEMHVVHHKTSLTVAQHTAGVIGLAGYDRATHAAYTSTPVDPAGVAVIAYQIDVSFFISLFSKSCMQIDVPLFRLELKMQSCCHSQMKSIGLQ